MTTFNAPATSIGPGFAEFDGVRALVTGAASGIGRATARALRMRGAAVASLDVQPLSEPEEDILEISCDVGRDPSVREAVAEVADRLGGLDVVVSNAGIGSTGGVEDVTDEEWHHVLDTNVLGTARLVRAALPHLRLSAPTGRAPSSAPALSLAGPAWCSELRTVPARAPCTRSSSRWQPILYGRACGSTPLPLGLPTLPGSGGCWPPRPIRTWLSLRSAPTTHGPARHRRTGRPRRVLPREPARRGHHRYCPAGRRRLPLARLAAGAIDA